MTYIIKGRGICNLSKVGEEDELSSKNGCRAAAPQEVKVKKG